MPITVGNTVIEAISGCLQDERRVKEGLDLWERYKHEMSPDQDQNLKEIHAAAQAKFNDPLRFMGV